MANSFDHDARLFLAAFTKEENARPRPRKNIFILVEELLKLSKLKGYAFPSIKFLAGMLRTTGCRIHHMINELEDKEWFLITRGHTGCCNRYFPNWDKLSRKTGTVPPRLNTRTKDGSSMSESYYSTNNTSSLSLRSKEAGNTCVGISWCFPSGITAGEVEDKDLKYYQTKYKISLRQLDSIYAGFERKQIYTRFESLSHLLFRFDKWTKEWLRRNSLRKPYREWKKPKPYKPKMKFKLVDPPKRLPVWDTVDGKRVIVFYA